MNPDAALDACRSGRVRAAIPVHVHGDPWPWTELMAETGVPVVEDACQAHGATLDGRPVGSMGLLGAFSLNAVKNLPAGQGGMVTTNDDQAATLVRTFCSAGRLDGGGLVDVVGHAYPITEVAAARAREGLALLAERSERAAAHASRIVAALSGTVGVPYRGGVAHKVPLVFRNADRADEALKRLTDAGVPVCRWQVAPIALHPAFGRDPSEFPGASSFVARHLMLGTERYPVVAQTSEIIDEWIESALPIIEEVQQ
jgi:dTDP-4-amino-4,6-dideoxygalactose transaminase